MKSVRLILGGDIMKEVYLKTVKLFKELHQYPEYAMEEVTTKRILMDFIKNNTSCEIYDLGNSFYAYHKASTKTDDNIAFRSDMDAVKISEDSLGHYCGHDGHSASLAGFLLLIDKLELNKNIYALFQSGEETGVGAKELNDLIKDLNINEIYSYHNIPGYELGKILLKKDTFACASTGMILKFKGAVSHAAYPSSGKNPSFALARLIEEIEKINNIERDYIEFITIVGTKMGDRNFGVSCGDAELDITIRSENENSLNDIIDFIKDKSSRLAIGYGLEFVFEMIEPFPETRNHNDYVDKIEYICQNLKFEYEYLKEPMHWSEDFGYYLKDIKGCFMGVGNGYGDDLHTINYTFDPKLILKVWMVYLKLI